MSTLTTIASSDAISASRSVINTNFSTLNTDKAELSGWTFTGDISVPDEAYGVGWNWSVEVPTKNAIYDKIETMWSGGSVATDAIWDAKWDLAGWTGANTASRLAVGTNWQVLTADSAEATGLKWSTPAGGWDALTSWTLAQFASTTSLELKGVISDETGSGSLVFATSPTLVTPVLGVATATSINGATITSGTLNWSVTWTNTGDQTSIVWITGTKAQFDTAVTDWNIVYSGDSPTLGTITTTGNIELGNASDTTISRVSAGVIAVEGVTVPTLSSTSTLTNKTLTAPIITYSINAQTGTTYTLVLTDQSKLVTLTNAAAIAVTIPTNASVAFPVWTQIDFSQDGAWKVTFSGADVTINSLSSLKSIGGQYVGATLVKTATDTWNLYWNLVS